MQDNTLAISDLILSADIFVQLIMLILIIASVVSWTLIFSKKVEISKNAKLLRAFSQKFNNEVSFENAFNVNDTSPVTTIFKEARAEYMRGENHNSERATKTLYLHIDNTVNSLEKSLSTLATIGSVSPYVGLLGTVWGIMHAFLGLASVKQATIAIVAPGIAEALIATAFGLFAAIPASMFYNRLTAEIDGIYNEYHRIAGEYITIMNR